MNRETPQSSDPISTLSEADARLLDLLIEQGPDALATDDPRAQRVVAVWSQIGRWPAEQPAEGLMQQTLARLKQGRTSRAVVPPVKLSPQDAAVLDAMVESRQLASEQGPVPAGSAQRAKAIRGLLALLGKHASENTAPSAELSAKTLARIQEHRSAGSSMRLADHRTAAATSSRGTAGQAVLRRVGVAAAVLIVSASVLLPVLSKARSDAQTVACRENLREAGQGLAAYSQAHDGQLPHTAGGTFGLLARFATDAIKPQPQTTDQLTASPINLYLLPKQGYTAEANLTCPTQARQAAEDQGQYYNAQNALAGRPVRLSDLDAPLLADNSPVYRRVGNTLLRNAQTPDDAASLNHRGKGQNVMHHDGSSRWTIRPAVQRAGMEDLLWVRDRAGKSVDVFLTP